MLDADGCTCRPENGAVEDLYLRVPAALRDYLRLFKGCRLSVLLALAVRCDESGWVSISNEMLSAETGYNKATISYTLADLCRMRINSRRVLMPRDQSSWGGTSGDVSYELFPGSEEEVVSSRESVR